MSSKSSRNSARLQPPTRACVFCGSRGRLTEEHVFGDWIRKLGFSGEGTHQWAIDSGSPVVHKAGPFSKKLKVACQPCNGEWMSGMEKAVKPLLTPMFEGRRVELGEQAQHDLARWAFKSIIVAAHIDRQHGRIDQAQRHTFRQTNEPPRGTIIRIGAASVTASQYGTHLGEYSFRPRVVNVTAPGGTADISAYTARFRLLNVFFDIFGYVSKEWDVSIQRSNDVERALLPIWPFMNPTIWWPPVVSVDTLGGLRGLEQGERWEGIPMLT